MLRVIIINLFFITFLFSNESYMEIDPEIKKYLTQTEINYINNKKTIIASNEFDYEPMDFNIEGIPVGYSVDLLNVLAKSLGLKVKYETKSWTELLESLHSGKIDLMHTIYKNEEREKTLYFSFPYLIGENAYIIRETSPHIEKIEDLYGKKVGITKGWLEERFINNHEEIEKIYYEDLKDKLDALSIGKIDAILNDRNIAKYYIRKYGFSNLKISSRVVQNSNEELDKYYFSTLKKDSILISILNKAFINMDVKSLEELQEKWFGSRSKGEVTFTLKEQRYLDSRKKIKICITKDLLPISGFSKGKVEGMVSDILRELKDKVDLDFEIKETTNLKNTFDSLQKNLCEVVPTAEFSEKNMILYNLTQPYLDIPYVAVGKKDKEFFSDISELKGKKISVISNTSLIRELKERVPSIEIINVNSIKEGFDLVKNGKVYSHLTLYPIARFQIAKSYYNDLKIIGRLLKPMQLSIATNKKDELLASILEKSISAIPSTKMNAILNNWVEAKVQKVVDYNFLYKILAGIFLLILLGLWRYHVLKRKNIEIKIINSQLHRSKEALRKQKEEFEAIFRYSKDGIAILDLDSKFVNYNQACLNMLGFSKKELHEKKLLELVIEEEKKGIEKIFKNVLQSGHFDNVEKTFLGKDNKRIAVNITIILMPDKNRVLLTVKDVTSIKLLESQSKLASMGEMIGNIAHQWRQPLSIITTSASGLSIKADMKQEITNEDITEFSEQIIKQADYLSKTIDDFRNFIKVDIHYQPISVKESLTNAITLTTAAIKGNYIVLVKDLEDDLIIDGNKNELSQAFINIINNAKDKLKEISEQTQSRYIFISTKLLDNKTIQVKIKDNGGGVDEKLINRIFEPYFTTKHQSVGTGLGLSMSEKIIRERHNGSIQVHNEEFNYESKNYKGAAFVITFHGKK